MAIRPLAILFCDDIATTDNGQMVLFKTFNNLRHMGPFPAVKPSFCILVEFTGATEQFRVMMEGPGIRNLLAVDSVPPVEAREHEFQRHATTFVAKMSPIAFQQPGVYSVVVYEGEAEVARREFGLYALDGPETVEDEQGAVE